MHANTASVSSVKENQITMAFNAAKNESRKMRDDHGDKSFSIRDIVVGMVRKTRDGRTVTISPGIAKRILDEANFPGQRRITPDRLYEAKRSIQDGSWNPSHVIHAVKLADGAFWIVNGQTRLSAIAECGKPMLIGIIIQDVADEHEARSVYTQFDRGPSVRTTNQILNASGVAGNFGLPNQLATYLFSAVGIVNNGLRVPTGSMNDESAIEARNMSNKLQWIGEWAKEALLYFNDIEECFPRGNIKKRRAMMRSGTLAVALLTYRYQQEKAHKFWRSVCDQENLKKYDPRNTLSRDIEARDARFGVAYQSIQQAALAWNAYVQGRELKIIKCTADWKLHLEGTPIKGAR